MVYGGPKNGFQVKFEQIQGSPEDSEVEDDEDDTKNRLAITAASDEDNESALVRLDDVNGIQELKMKKLDKAWLSAKELVDTERRYVSKLHLLDQVKILLRTRFCSITADFSGFSSKTGTNARQNCG